MISKTDALLKLCPGAEWLMQDDKIVKWHSKDIKQPTDKEINDKLTELQADYDAKQYQRDRQYPELGEQFDLLFKDIDSGKVSKDGGFYKAIKSVKDKHPKPSE